MSAQQAPHNDNPPFFVHVKMLAVCFGAAVALAGGIITAGYLGYLAVIAIGSH